MEEIFNFYQDYDPEHKAYEIKTRLLIVNCPKVMETPLQSPDLNPIANLWGQLEVKGDHKRSHYF